MRRFDCLRVDSLAAPAKFEEIPSWDEEVSFAKLVHSSYNFIGALRDRSHQLGLVIVEELETAEAPAKAHLLAALALLDAVLDVICIGTHGMCYIPGAYEEQLDAACEALELSCGALPDCAEFVTDSLCGSLRRDSGVLMELMEGLENFVSFILGRDPLAPAPRPPARCEITAPRRLVGVNRELRQLSPEAATMMTEGRVLQVLLHHELPSNVERFVVNLGAGDGYDAMDSANCLIEYGWSGWLGEADHGRAELLRKRFAGRGDVWLSESVIEPSQFLETVLTAVLSDGRELRRDVPFPAFLKIDVDNGDCHFLSSWLETGFRPLAIELEILHSFVPPEVGIDFKFSHWWLGNVTEQYNHAQAVWARGCSLGSMLNLLQGEYVLVALGFKKPINAEFVLASWADELGLAPVIDIPEIRDMWPHMVTHRERLDTFVWHGPSLDVRMLVDEAVTPEQKKEEVLSAYKQHMGRLLEEGLLDEASWRLMA